MQVNNRDEDVTRLEKAICLSIFTTYTKWKKILEFKPLYISLPNMQIVV